MTLLKEKKNLKSYFRSKFALIFFLICTALLFLCNESVKLGFINGLKLSALTIIPAIFPFFILSDFLLCFYEPKNNIFSRAFERMLGISSSGFKAYIIGVMCGFPLGAKCAAELYSKNKISLSECERLCAIASSPSLAFVISGIGLGLRGSLRDGILMYFCVIISSIFTGMILKKAKEKSQNSAEIAEQNFALTESIKRSAYSSLSISAYIALFSSLLFLIDSLIKNDTLLLFISSFLEVGNASVLISKSSLLSPQFSFSLTAFALSFSGISVFMQGLEYLPKEASKIKILCMKFIQGVISFFTAGIIFRLFL